VLLYEGPAFPGGGITYRIFAWVHLDTLGIEQFQFDPQAGHWKEFGRPSVPLTKVDEVKERLARFLKSRS
jgi:hypothetical protein